MWDALALKTESIRHESGLQILRNADRDIEDVICRATFVSTYVLNEAESHWSRAESEGALYIVRRNCEPKYRLIVLNQRNPLNMVENITAAWELSSEENYVFFRVPKDTRSMEAATEPKGRRVVGFWFSEESERLVVQAHLTAIVNEQKALAAAADSGSSTNFNDTGVSFPPAPDPPKTTPVFPTQPLLPRDRGGPRTSSYFPVPAKSTKSFHGSELPKTSNTPRRGRYQIASRAQIAAVIDSKAQTTSDLSGADVPPPLPTNKTEAEAPSVPSPNIRPLSSSSHPFSLLSQFRQAFGLAGGSPPIQPPPAIPVAAASLNETSKASQSAMGALLSNRVLKFMRGNSSRSSTSSPPTPTALEETPLEVPPDGGSTDEADVPTSSAAESPTTSARRGRRMRGGRGGGTRSPSTLLRRHQQRLAARRAVRVQDGEGKMTEGSVDSEGIALLRRLLLSETNASKSSCNEEEERGGARTTSLPLATAGADDLTEGEEGTSGSPVPVTVALSEDSLRIAVEAVLQSPTFAKLLREKLSEVIGTVSSSRAPSSKSSASKQR